MTETLADEIRVPLDDGRVLLFPKGTTPEIIEATKARVLSAAPNPSADLQNRTAAPPATAISAPARGKGDPGALSDSFLARAARGAVINTIDPAAEMLVRGARKVGLASDEDVRGVQAQNVERQRLQAESRERVGSTGLDGAGLAGTAAVGAVTLPRTLGALGMRALANPRSLLDITKAGAASGGIAGVLGPTEGGEQMSDAQLAMAKARQGGIGTVFGGVTAPVAAVGLDKLAGGVKTAAGSVRQGLSNVLSPSRDVALVRDPRQLDAYLTAQAQASGVNWAAVPDTIKESLREATRRATSSTGNLPTEAVRNRMIAEAENLPQLTLGQSTRDPSQFSREMNSPEETLRNYLGSQRNTATARLGGLGDQFGAPRTPYALGADLGTEVAGQAEARRKAIGALYDSFRDDAAGYHKIANTPDFVRSALMRLKTEQSFDDLPPVFQRQLLELEESGKPLSIRDAAQLWKNINAHHRTTAGSPAGNAVGTVKAELGQLLDTAKFNVTDKGSAIIDKFQAANAARREMGKWEESSGAISDMAGHNPRVASERLFDRFVLNGSVDDFNGLWKTIPDPLQKSVKRQFVDEVTSRAMNRFGTQATGAASATKLLRDFPKEKLEAMFKPGELRSLRNTLEYLRLVSEAPAGNFVNRSNSLVDLKDFLSQTSNVPLAGPWFSKPLRAMQEQNAASEALNPSSVLAPMGPAPAGRVARELIRRTPGVVAPRAPDVSRLGQEVGREEE